VDHPVTTDRDERVHIVCHGGAAQPLGVGAVGALQPLDRDA
jgi:hypothetical protein